MNNFKKSVIKTAVFFTLFSGLASYYYFVEVRHKDAAAHRQAQAGKILQHDFADCANVLITRPGSEIRLAKGNEGKWTVKTDKIMSLADSNKIEEVAGALFGIVPSRILMNSADASILSEFGLTPETGINISFTFASGAKTSCLFGDENPSGKAVYMQISKDARVFLVPKIVRESLMYPADHFRDRQIIHFVPADVYGLKITHGKDSVAIVKNEKRWNVETDKKTKADKDKIISLLSELSTYTAEGFIDAPNKEELESFETAPLTIELTLKDSSKKLITLGNTIKGKDVNRFVKTDEVDYLLKVNADYMEKFAKTRDFFVSKKIIEFDPWEMGKAELKIGIDKTAVLTRKDFKWITDTGKETNLSEFLWALTECRYKNIAEVSPATLTFKAAIVLERKQGPAMKEIVFLTSEKEKAQTWFIKYNDKVFEVKAEIGTKLENLINELEDK